MANVNRIYAGDNLGQIIINGYVGKDKIYDVVIDDSKEDSGSGKYVAKLGASMMLGTLLAGPIGTVIGSTAVMKNLSTYYHAVLKFGNNKKGMAWIDQRTLNYFMNK